MAQKRVLHVGCGIKDIRGMPRPFQEEGWSEIRLDINPAVRPDMIGTMTDLSAVPSSSVDAVFSSHNIEHLYPHEVSTALAEFRRVLSPDGFVLVTCPDLQTVAALIVQDKLTEPAYHSPAGPITPLDILFGHGASIAAGNTFMAHRGGFTMKSLLDALVAAGYPRVFGRRRPERLDLWGLASNRNLSELRIRELAARFLPA